MPLNKQNYKIQQILKRGILEWISNAKRAETRDKRIAETVNKAAQNIRANQYTPKQS